MARSSQVGCVFPMVIWFEFRMGQYRDDEDRKDATPLYIFWYFIGELYGSNIMFYDALNIPRNGGLIVESGDKTFIFTT